MRAREFINEGTCEWAPMVVEQLKRTSHVVGHLLENSPEHRGVGEFLANVTETPVIGNTYYVFSVFWQGEIKFLDIATDDHSYTLLKPLDNRLMLRRDDGKIMTFPETPDESDHRCHATALFSTLDKKIETLTMLLLKYSTWKINNRVMKEDISAPELQGVVRFANNLWNKLGVDVKFSHHFIERLSDPRNVKPISAAELIRIFKKEYERWGKTIQDLPMSQAKGRDHNEAEAVMKDELTKLNLPFVIIDKPDGQNDLILAKTNMRKDDFKSPDPIYPVKESRKK